MLKCSYIFKQDYLEITLKSIFDNMSKKEQSESLIVVLIAETDPNYVAKRISGIQSLFQKHLDTGLLELIAPPSEYYPNMDSLRYQKILWIFNFILNVEIRETMGDDLKRVQWRSKQNLDYAFLMMYSQTRGFYYVQLEDDIITKPKFVQIYKNFFFICIKSSI